MDTPTDSVYESILDTIGNTPVIELQNITPGAPKRILAKLEFMNPSGSLKDRIYLEMIRAAERRGELRRGMTILEASTGNAGVSCVFVGTMLGYDVRIVMPDGMSEERKKLMRAYGARLEFTPGAESDVDLALDRVEEIRASDSDKYWVAGQFSNPDNIEAHYKTTGPELWRQCGGDIDLFVVTQGTGGTITGVGRYLKEHNPSVKLFAGEPAECPILSNRQWGSHRIEGIGDGFVPRNLDVSILDGVVTISSKEAIEMARRLALKEGLFVGISSGANVVAALKCAEELGPDVNTIVTLMNDTGQRYFSTDLFDTGKDVHIPDREHHIMDEYSRRMLDEHSGGWTIIR